MLAFIWSSLDDGIIRLESEAMWFACGELIRSALARSPRFARLAGQSTTAAQLYWLVCPEGCIRYQLDCI